MPCFWDTLTDRALHRAGKGHLPWFGADGGGRVRKEGKEDRWAREGGRAGRGCDRRERVGLLNRVGFYNAGIYLYLVVS